MADTWVKDEPLSTMYDAAVLAGVAVVWKDGHIPSIVVDLNTDENQSPDEVSVTYCHEEDDIENNGNKSFYWISDGRIGEKVDSNGAKTSLVEVIEDWIQ